MKGRDFDASPNAGQGDHRIPTPDELFVEYQAAIVSACDHSDPAEEYWTDPALIAAVRCQPCVVMTAWNPGLYRPGRAANEAANHRMLKALQGLGCEVWNAECASPDGQFREPAFLIWDLPVPVGVQVASQFAQFAIYAYSSDGERTVVPTQSGSGESWNRGVRV